MYDPARGYPSVVPCVLYDDLPMAVDWINRTLDFQEVLRATLPDGWTGHSEMERDGLILLLGRRGGQLGESSSITQIYVDDVDSRCKVAVDHGGSVLDGPVDRPWGVRQAVVADPEGQRWVLTHHLRDTEPSTWYGTVLGSIPG